MFVQFSGINGVLYYTPQILEEAGVAILLADLGLSSTSSSFLISAVTTLLMLPSIGIAMRLMDVTGRRYVLYFFYVKKIPMVFFGCILVFGCPAIKMLVTK
jgi:MFS family permease